MADRRKDLTFRPFKHPLDLASFWTTEELYDWQSDILTEIALPYARVLASTNNESGKTSILIPVFGLSCMVAFPGCFVYSTSGSEEQVRQQLFVNQLAPLIDPMTGWHISTASMTVTSPNGSRWVGYKCKEGGRVEGFHGKPQRDRYGERLYRPCVYIMDECKSIDNTIFEAVLRIDPDFRFGLSTPGLEAGWFYDGINPDELEMTGDDPDDQWNPEEMDTESLKSRIKELEGKL